MTRRIPFRSLALALFVLLLAPLSAHADNTHKGRTALVISATLMSGGPGTQYPLAGRAAKAEEVAVERCFRRWCQVEASGGEGWISLDNLSFGQYARGPFSGPKFNVGRGGPGQVCLYSGTGYSGTELCGGSGLVIRDLALAGMDNVFSSVKVVGNVSVLVCRDFYFSSYCETLTGNTPVLDRFLRRAVSSIRIY